MLHFEPDYTPTVKTISAVIATLNSNEVAALRQVLTARLEIINAESSKLFSVGDKVEWSFQKGKRLRTYRYGGTITSVAPVCNVLASTGRSWLIPSRMLEKKNP